MLNFIINILAILPWIPKTMLPSTIINRTMIKLKAILTEYAFFFLVFKLMIMIYNSIVCTFDDTTANHPFHSTIILLRWPEIKLTSPTLLLTSEILYWFDIVVALGLWALTLDSYFCFWKMDDATRIYKHQNSSIPPPVYTLSYWFRLMNPWWTSRHVSIHSDVKYTIETEHSTPFHNLDIYMHENFHKNRPVLIYLHGGYWKFGDKKKNVPPFIQYMALKKWVVVSVNYRPAPFAYPKQVMDVKRAILWVKCNIYKYGGDPNFLAISGSESGAHLASLVALTPNDPFYQKGFEQFDTSIQACVTFNAPFDFANARKRLRPLFMSWLFKTVLGIQKEKSETIMEWNSPAQILHDILQTRQKLASVALNGLPIGPKRELTHKRDQEMLFSQPKAPIPKTGHEILPPFLIFHGKQDTLFPFRLAKDFSQTYSQLSKSPISMCFIPLSLTGTNYETMSCPRGHYVAYAMERFLGYFYREYQEIHLKEE